MLKAIVSTKKRTKLARSESHSLTFQPFVLFLMHTIIFLHMCNYTEVCLKKKIGDVCTNPYNNFKTEKLVPQL